MTVLLLVYTEIILPGVMDITNLKVVDKEKYVVDVAITISISDNKRRTLYSNIKRSVNVLRPGGEATHPMLISQTICYSNSALNCSFSV